MVMMRMVVTMITMVILVRFWLRWSIYGDCGGVIAVVSLAV